VTECARCELLIPAGDELCRGCEEYVAAEVSRDREFTIPRRGA
jgi:RNA polymerase subunit RPABC4/transcription elongation factor Spt4